MATLTIINDTHVNGKYQTKVTEADLLAIKPSPTTYFNGDVVEIMCADKKDIPHNQRLIQTLKDKHGEDHVGDGNHDPDSAGGSCLYHKLEDGRLVVIRHFDLELDYAKWFKYRQKDPGANLWKKMFWMPFVKAFHRHDIPMDAMARAAKYAKDRGAKVYIGAHCHPTEEIRAVIDGILVVIEPIGINEVSL